MSRFLRFFGLEKRSAGFGSLAEILRVAAETSAGISVDPSTALKFAPVAAAVRLISESCAQLPVHLFSKSPDGGRRREDQHPVEFLLTRRPNEWSTPFGFKADLTAQLLLRGEAFALIVRASDGRPLELIPLPAGTITVTTADDLSPVYTLTGKDGRQRVLDRREVFHLRGLSTGSGRPFSPVIEGREAIGLGLALERHASNLMAKGARPAGVVETSGRLSEGAIARMKASIEAAHSGAQAGRTMVLEENAKFSPLTFSSVDLEFQAMRSFQVAEISRIFRVPLSLLSEMDRVTHANAESLGAQFLALTLQPILRLWIETIARDLLAEDELFAGLYAEFQTNALVMTDLAARFDALQKAVGAPWLTPDEARALENRAPITGGNELVRQAGQTGAAVATHG